MRQLPTRKDLLKIVRKYISGKASEKEKEFLEAYYNRFEQQPDYLENQDAAGVRTIRLELKAAIDQSILQQKGRRIPLWPKLAAAASVLAIVSLLVLYPSEKRNRISEQILPIHNGITLTLANGQQIAIDKASKGTISLPDGSTANHSGAALDYSAGASSHTALQTLSNNTGSTFKLKLSEGTEVYLDVNSSITYPTVFKGAARNVSISGQAYFKVVHNAGRPFIVQAGNETVKDIGTEFNINQYGIFKTTLVTGAISVRNQVLQPGTQAAIENGSMVIRPANVEMETAWIHDKIIFDHTTLEDILSQVSRIYGTQINWENNHLKQLEFGGSLSRTNQLSTILNFLRKTGEVNFKVDQNTIHVLNP